MSDGTVLGDSMPRGDDRWSHVRPLRDGWRAVRSITLRRWLWATFLGALALGGYLAGIAPSVLTTWQAPQLLATGVQGLLGAYVILLAISVAEYQCPYGNSRKRRYWIAGATATVVMVVAETSVAALFPLTIRATGMPGVERLIGVAVRALMNWSLVGGLAIVVYARLQGVQNARAGIRAAELARAEASRKVLALRLAALQARVEPKLLLGTLSQIEALYDRDIGAGAKMLSRLIAYLRSALPQLRDERSTLGREARLTQSYLDLVQLRMGSRLDFTVDIPPKLAKLEMPPMLLLPLTESAVRGGLEPLPLGGKVDISARATGNRVRVTIADNGLIPRNGIGDASDLATLRARLHGIYGASAELSVVADTPPGMTVVIELPHETNGAHRGR